MAGKLPAVDPRGLQPAISLGLSGDEAGAIGAPMPPSPGLWVTKQR